jgi:glycosyltransferase involved in cell wall biosynthesis
MSCGTPVVATNWSGPTEFINEKNGYLISIEKDLVEAKYFLLIFKYFSIACFHYLFTYLYFSNYMFL